MEKEEKIKIAVTAGVMAAILLILVFVLAFGKTPQKSEDEAKLEENIIGYAEQEPESSDAAAPVPESGTVKSPSSESDKSDDGGQGQADASKSLSLAGAAVSSSSSAISSTGASQSSSTGASQSSSQGASQSSSHDSSQASSKGASFVSQTKKTYVSGNSFYPKKEAVLKNVYKSMKVNVNEQLKEMYSYWEAGNTEAVRDLAHLERFEAMSYQLLASADYYYYGDTNSSGKPHGTGLAVYSGDQYYFGKWADGVRSGEGTWICFYPAYSDNTVTEHMYSGDWAGDLPNGKGQEHIDYDQDRMNDKDIYLQNAIGGFYNGLYDGEMYIITVDNDDDIKEWEGTCSKGSFKQIPYAAVDKDGLLPVLNEREDSENHIYLSEKSNVSNGVTGIITGGKIRK